MRPFAPLALALVAVCPPPARAAIGTLDIVPAATILIPFFEADVAASTFPNGDRDMTVAITNPTSAAVLTNVTIWTDLGIPVYRFNMAVLPHHVEAFSMRQVLTGTLPQTSVPIEGCGAFLPPPAITLVDLANLQSALRGGASSLLGDKCGGRPSPNGMARGFLTVDTVKICASATPADSFYFTDVASSQNALLGTFADIDGPNNAAAAENAVHIEASASDPRTTTAGRATFYGRLVGWSAADHREPLATRWSTPYVSGGSEIVVWRDPQTKVAPFSCGSPPAPLPLEELVAFDTDEQPLGLRSTQLLGAVAARVRVGGTAGGLPVTAKAGWLFISTNLPAGTAGPSSDPKAGQSFVYSTGYPERGFGRFSAAVQATQLDSGTDPKHGALVP